MSKYELYIKNKNSLDKVELGTGTKSKLELNTIVLYSDYRLYAHVINLIESTMTVNFAFPKEWFPNENIQTGDTFWWYDKDTDSKLTHYCSATITGIITMSQFIEEKLAGGLFSGENAIQGSDIPLTAELINEWFNQDGITCDYTNSIFIKAEIKVQEQVSSVPRGSNGTNGKDGIDYIKYNRFFSLTKQSDLGKSIDIYQNGNTVYYIFANDFNKQPTAGQWCEFYITDSNNDIQQIMHLKCHGTWNTGMYGLYGLTFEVDTNNIDQYMADFPKGPRGNDGVIGPQGKDGKPFTIYKEVIDLSISDDADMSDTEIDLLNNKGLLDSTITEPTYEVIPFTNNNIVPYVQESDFNDVCGSIVTFYIKVTGIYSRVIVDEPSNTESTSHTEYYKVHKLYLVLASWDNYTQMQIISKTCITIPGEKGNSGSDGKNGIDGRGIYLITNTFGAENITIAYDSLSIVNTTNLSLKKGDILIDSSSNVFYVDTIYAQGGSGPLQVILHYKFSIKGDKGNIGPSGPGWYCGTSISDCGIVNAKVNDLYLNTNTADVKKCIAGGNATTSKWEYATNLKGKEGDSYIMVKTVIYKTYAPSSGGTIEINDTYFYPGVTYADISHPVILVFHNTTTNKSYTVLARVYSITGASPSNKITLKIENAIEFYFTAQESIPTTVSFTISEGTCTGIYEALYGIYLTDKKHIQAEVHLLHLLDNHIQGKTQRIESDDNAGVFIIHFTQTLLDADVMITIDADDQVKASVYQYTNNELQKVISNQSISSMVLTFVYD